MGRTVKLEIGRALAATIARYLEEEEGFLEMTLRWEKGTVTLDVGSANSHIYSGEDLRDDPRFSTSKPSRQLWLLHPFRAPPARGLPVGNDGAKPLATGNLCLNFQRRRVMVEGQEIRLTPVEFKLLSYLAQNEGEIVPYETLLRETWGRQDARQRLKVHIQRIRHKLGDNCKASELILNERGIGYKLVASPGRSGARILGVG